MTFVSWSANNWIPIPGYESYLINGIGDVRSKRFPDRTLTHTFREPGRPMVHLYKAGISKPFLVQTLIALAFHGPRPEGHVVRHLNDDSMDNRPENIAYGTWSQNTQDIIRNGNNWHLLQTACKNGHAFTAVNTSFTKTGSRRCRTCHREQQAAYRAQAKITDHRAWEDA